jgi:NTE family protein
MYTNLVLSGGSIKGFSILGAIQYLEEKNIMKDIKNLIGSSFGAIVCFCLVIGYDSLSISKLLAHYVHEYDVSDTIVDNIINITFTMGIDNGDYIISCLKKILHFKYQCNDITFIELAKKSGKNLVICGANVSASNSEYFCLDNTPDMSVVLALRISTSIPLIFCPVMHNNSIYVDGGLFNNFPIDYFTESNPLKDTIGISVINTLSKEENPNNIFTYIAMIINSMLNKLNDKTINTSKQNVVLMNINGDNLCDYSFQHLKFEITNDKIQEYIKFGYDVTKDKLQLEL